MNRWRILCGICCLWASAAAWGDGPADNLAEKVRPVPPPGIMVPEADRKTLEQGLATLDQMLSELRQPAPTPPATMLRQKAFPDIEVLRKAVHDALTYGEFFNPNDIVAAHDLLKLGIERAQSVLREMQAPWTTQTGLVVRGYVSVIDGSVQPYGLVIPANYNFQGTDKVRLDIWCHGRGEVLSEVNFLQNRRTSIGQISPPNAIVLHLYGRYCNANKFAGEIDCLEALAAVKQQYRIDEDRIVMRGFSMGGAAAWQFAVHYADQWVAAAPGAGFSETPEFLRIFQKEDVSGVPAYEQKLWHWYDCPDWSLNLAQLPTIAYSGEDDIQKQAADIMERKMATEGLRLLHLIGPKTGHSYHPESAAEIERRLAEIVARGRNRTPARVDFVTYTLRYNRMHWLTVDELAEHWSDGAISAVISGPPQANRIDAKTKGITAFSINLPAGSMMLYTAHPVSLVIDDQPLTLPAPFSDGSWTASVYKTTTGWQVGTRPTEANVVLKSHGLQGPIDDAFLSSFLFVLPTGQPLHATTGEWVAQESQHAISHWRKQFRGEARVKKDTEVTEADIQNHNLVLWGDAQSNSLIGRVASKLPVPWGNQGILAAAVNYPAESHVLVSISPNPLNPSKYVVLNSGFTFREYDYLNNARQVSKLPDWAIIDITTPANFRLPGKVAAAGFFNEKWQLPTAAAAGQ